MDILAGKASACLREAASAKAGANLSMSDFGLRILEISQFAICNQQFVIHFQRPPFEALESGLPMPGSATDGSILIIDTDIGVFFFQ
jgi:hypothetical protein